MTTMFPGNPWFCVKDGDSRAFDLFSRHYSFNDYTDGRRRNFSNPQRHLFVGPGEKLVLMTSFCDALFVWRKFKSLDNQDGVNCAVFRNESDFLSSDLIKCAEELAVRKWGGCRAYTYVNPRLITSTNPGYCFKIAGWTVCGTTKVNKLLIFEKQL